MLSPFIHRALPHAISSTALFSSLYSLYSKRKSTCYTIPFLVTFSVTKQLLYIQLPLKHNKKNNQILVLVLESINKGNKYTAKNKRNLRNKKRADHNFKMFAISRVSTISSHNPIKGLVIAPESRQPPCRVSDI